MIDLSFSSSKSKRTTVTAMTYDFLSRTTQITKTGQATQSYDYDDQNRRIRKTVGSVANNYLYQGEDILAEYANGWAAATGFITHGATTDVPLTWQPAANDPVGSRYFHQDGLGSIVAMSTTSGTTDMERFDAWGAKLIGTGAIPLYGYTGREQDGTPATGTGFIYYRARYYDPANGRFTQRDPIELRGGINLYTYVGGNPVVRVDPSGLDGFDGLYQYIQQPGFDPYRPLPPAPNPMIECRISCTVDFLNPLPNMATEYAAQKALGELAAEYLKKFNKAKGAYDLGQCLNSCCNK
jgi:RHS repeat-associated protein